MPDEGPYDLGDDVILTATFTTTVAGVDTPTNPTVVVCTVEAPDGTITTINNPTNPSVGVFEATFTPVVSGEHWYRFVGTGAAKAAGERSFSVRPQRVP